MELIKELNEKNNKTIIIISHNIYIVKKYCKTIVKMDKGKIKYVGPVNGAGI